MAKKKSGASLLKIILVILFGFTGWQRFVKGNWISGLVFLVSGGLFGIGWIIDAVTTITDNKTVFFNM